MINVDNIYVIALEERKSQIMDEMLRHGMDCEIVEATICENGIEGLQKSMEKVLYYAIAKRLLKIMIVEDDCIFECKNPTEKINECISELPDDFNILQLGTNFVVPPTPYSKNLFKVSYGLGTHCSIYSVSTLEKIISLLDNKTHLDAIIHQHIQSLGNCYCSKELIANQRDGYSFIEKKIVRYGSMMKRKYQQWNSQLSM